MLFGRRESYKLSFLMTLSDLQCHSSKTTGSNIDAQLCLL